MSVEAFLRDLGPDITSIEEEYFSVFSEDIPSQSLGFVDSKATCLDLTINGRDLTIHQSPTILTSSRGGGTTGAVVWKVTPFFAEWITSLNYPLLKREVITKDISVLELGCGISGIIALTVAPLVRSYTLTDQSYVLKLLNQNLEENKLKSKTHKSGSKFKKSSVTTSGNTESNITARTLDWETDEVSSLTSPTNSSFDIVIACDCIYNDALITPLVQTCADACRLRQNDSASNGQPTLCIVGQQRRSSEVFEDWLIEFSSLFKVWRVPDELLNPELRTNSGYLIHNLINSIVGYIVPGCRTKADERACRS